MATVTDLTHGASTTTDESQGVTSELGQDTNLNVFTFGGLILGDLFPSLQWVVNQMGDESGSSLTLTDGSGSSVTDTDSAITNSEVYDFSEFSYDQSNINYEGVRVQGSVIDTTGS